MLRSRLFYGLVIMVLLVWGVGAVTVLVMRDSISRFETRLKSNYQPIDASQSIRTLTATLNANYLPALASEQSSQLIDRTLYDDLKNQLRSCITVINSSPIDNSRQQDIIVRLSQATESYLKGYESYFSKKLITAKDREEIMRIMGMRTQQLTDLSENLINLSGQNIFSEAKQLEDASTNNSLLVTTLVLLGSAIATLIYFHLARHLVDPVDSLHRSIKEIRDGNFELTLPEPRRHSEFGRVVSAFNSMAAELNLRRRENDETLMRTNLVNRAILAAIPSPVFVLGDDSSIMQINTAAEQLTEQIGTIGRLPLKIQSILDECKKSGTHFLPEDPREAFLFRIDEKEHYYLPRIFRFEAEDSKQSGWAILLHNVSRIRWLDDMKTNLIATVSHEIKTPLTGIRMVLHLLLEERSSKLDEMQKVMVTSANEDCERLLITLNILLDLSRAESGATYLEREALNITDSLKLTAFHYNKSASEKNIEVIVEDANSEFPKVSADKVALAEVLSNLVSNAVKNSPKNGKVRLRVSKHGSDHLRVIVSDEGSGVPEESQNRIFERFYRGPGQETNGVGLGLFISREIMRAHEGRIGLCERKSNLTEFYVDVPID